MKGLRGMHGKRVGKSFVLLLLTVVSLVVVSTPALAQSGKIAGQVVREDNGEPVIGASVIIEGYNRGAATDLNGEYFILAMRPGRYDMLIKALGYRPYRIEGVVVSSGLLTRIDASMVEEALEMEPVTVTFQRPPVNISEASQRISVEGDVARQMPISQSDDIVQIQPGITRDRDGMLHLRGGRSGEIGFIIDGIRVEDPLQGDLSTSIGRESLHELQLLTGTFSAEYGEAMSGLVNIVTREGDSQYKLNFEYESTMLNESPYRVADWSGENSDFVRTDANYSAYEAPEFAEGCDPDFSQPGKYGITLSGPMPFTKKNITFFMNATHNIEDSFLPFGGTWERNLMGKVVSRFGMSKVAFSFGFSAVDEQDYNHQWKYVPNHYHKHSEDQSRLSLTWTQSLSESFYYDVVFGLNRRLNKVKVFEDWETYMEGNYIPRDAYENQLSFFSDESMWSNVWRTALTETRSASTKFTWQITPSFQTQVGGDYKQQFLDLADLNYYYYTITTPLGSQYLNSEYFITQFSETPESASAWTQNTLTFEGLVIDAGLRFDYIDPKVGGWAESEDEKEGTVFKKAAVSRHLSPRLGIAHPISENVSMFFSYGQFFQFPDFASLFINSAETTADTFSSFSYGLPTGNPDLEPERTVAFEAGFKGIVGDTWGFTFTGFAKDVFNLLVAVSSSSSQTSTYYNVGSSRIIGGEFTVNKVLTRYWSLQANYTMSVARGDASDAVDDPSDDINQQYDDEWTILPEVWSDYYLDFDRRHVGNLMFTWQSSWTQYPNLLNSTMLRGFSLGMILSYASGLPYTAWYGEDDPIPQINDERMGDSFRVDMRVAKMLMSGELGVTVYLSVDNLFDKVNPLEVDRTSGEPWVTYYATEYGSTELTNDRVHDPSRVGIPRTIRFGVTLNL